MSRAAAQIIGVGVFVLTLVAHYALQFLAWASHYGHAVPLPEGSAGSPSVWWEATSFPVFWLVPGTLSTLHFDILLWINSGVWAAAATILLFLGWRFARRAT